MVAKKNAKNSKVKKKNNGVIVAAKLVNRFAFRHQLDAEGYNLVGEILNNISKLQNPKEQLEYQMKLLEYTYNRFDPVQSLTPEMDFKDNLEDEKTLNAEFKNVTDKEKDNDDFASMLKRI